MSKRLPDNTFEQYVALGPGRSYQALAEKLGVDKRTITRLAAKEKWVERLAKIQREAREATDRKIGVDIQAVRERQLMEARALRATALKAMKELPPERSLKAVSAAFGTAWKQELLLLGDPTERSEELSLKEAMLKRWNEWANPSPKGKPSEEGEAES